MHFWIYAFRLGVYIYIILLRGKEVEKNSSSVPNGLLYSGCSAGVIGRVCKGIKLFGDACFWLQTSSTQ